ncbi:hypothetical protein PACTADRAFT_50628 [Pachysolen tannophilus NRRL Y-2460]|uniref:Calcineurin-like phosphoesterase domain-containing protein n=1 Tax=Pachysolen tannophilus NRRL Y-2460 TaxID=669874 RepID=A0A1E4TSQ2_PACTA|nr:hypothetical protein PACTADRAFT_50628 [Pachysolen tannophilus NRRL Y-2460]
MIYGITLICLTGVLFFGYNFLADQGFVTVEQQVGSKLPNFAEELRNLRWGPLNFIHTTDTHGWYAGHMNQRSYSADWGDFISFTERMHEIADFFGVDLLVIDSGDKHDGNGLSDATEELNGVYSSRIFAQAKYDLLTLGNHELYVEAVSTHEYTHVVPIYGDAYVSTNVEYKLDNGTFVPFGNGKYRIFETKNQKFKILGLGILFDFTPSNNDKVRITPIKNLIQQDWFKELLEDNVDSNLDLIVIAGHVPVSRSWEELDELHNFLRNYFPNLPIQYFGGHSHIRDFTIFDNKASGLQSGRYCETVGWLSIESLTANELQYDRKYIDFNIHSFMHHSNTTEFDFSTPIGIGVTKEIAKYVTELELKESYGVVPRNFLVNASPYPSKGNLLSLLSEKILIRLVPKDKSLETTGNSRIIIINTGSIRYDLYKGPFTKNSKYIVSPFQNKWKLISSVPRSIAMKIEPVLNNQTYILRKCNNNDNDHDHKVEASYLQHNLDFSNLLNPIDQAFVKKKEKRQFEECNSNEEKPNLFDYFTFKALTYGYVTEDDMGYDGDDTIHKSLNYYPSPNVIQSYEPGSDLITSQNEIEELIDVVYYDFIEPYILFAMREIIGNEKDVEEYINRIQYYNDLNKEYNVGMLLQGYVEENWAN